MPEWGSHRLAPLNAHATVCIRSEIRRLAPLRPSPEQAPEVKRAEDKHERFRKVCFLSTWQRARRARPAYRHPCTKLDNLWNERLFHGILMGLCKSIAMLWT